MFGTHDLTVFVISGLLLNITPGADSLYIATRSASQGVRAGVAAVVGIGLGCCVHIVAAVLGLSAILATSARAFAVVKWAGVAYLVYLGLSMLRLRATSVPAGVAPAPWRTVVAQGLLTNVLNPKVALFFLAFLPQFVLPSAANKPLAFLFLGLIFAVNGVLWCLFLAWAAARVGTLGVVGPRTARGFSRGVGALFVALGLRLALAERG
jgi:threonine/homoserine/homoserine lactone efflux protein